MNDCDYNKILDIENRIKQENENISELEKEVREKYINNNNEYNYNNEDDENQFQINNKIAEEYGSNLNALRNENLFLKQSLEEKNKIIESFQNVSVEAQEKMKELINQNQKYIPDMKGAIELLNTHPFENESIMESVEKIKEEVFNI